MLKVKLFANLRVDLSRERLCRIFTLNSLIDLSILRSMVRILLLVNEVSLENLQEIFCIMFCISSLLKWSVALRTCLCAQGIETFCSTVKHLCPFIHRAEQRKTIQSLNVDNFLYIMWNIRWVESILLWEFHLGLVHWKDADWLCSMLIGDSILSNDLQNKAICDLCWTLTRASADFQCFEKNSFSQNRDNRWSFRQMNLQITFHVLSSTSIKKWTLNEFYFEEKNVAR